MKQYFPLTDSATKDVWHLIVVLAVYVLAGWASNILVAVTGWIPLVRVIVHILGWLLRVYCAVGIVYTLLVYFKVVKD
jgi:hypothetical protein